MSTAPSSIPPPSFDVAPELPEGIERPPPAREPELEAVDGVGGARRRLRRRAHGGARHRRHRLRGGLELLGPQPCGEHLGDDRAGPVLHRRRAALREHRRAGRGPSSSACAPRAFWPAVGWIAVAFAAFYVFTLVWVAILGVEPRRPKLPDELGVEDSTVALLAVAFLVAVVAPMAEEFFFRGFFYGALRNWRGPWPAAVITGLVFGGIHVGSAEAAFLLPLAFFGFALCLLRERTGSLYPGIALHCVNNSLAFGVSQHWSWQIPVLFACALGLIALVGLTVRARWTPAPAPAG